MTRNAYTVQTFSLIIILLVAGCTGQRKTTKLSEVEEVRPGVLSGYLTARELPNSLALLPVPPEEGSAAFAVDQEMSRISLKEDDSLRWKQAMQDAELMFPEALLAFSDILDVPVSEEQTPYLNLILRRSLTDAGLSTYMAKNHYKRERPFMMNDLATCDPESEEYLRTDGSYPSGHTAIGWTWALILCEVFPEHATAILDRGREFGESRIVCNVHWQSDVNEGRFMGASTVACLHANQTFLADLRAAKSEVSKLRRSMDD